VLWSDIRQNVRIQAMLARVCRIKSLLNKEIIRGKKIAKKLSIALIFE
jgi:hypothetical protein